MRPNDVSLDNCLKCSDCNSACPVLGANPSFPGPKHLGPELERLRRQGLPCDTPWVEYCLGCQRCDMICPNQVNVSELIAAAKARHQKPFIRRTRDFWLARPALLGKVLSILPGLSNAMLGLRPVRRLMATALKITAKRPFPGYVRADLCSPAVSATDAKTVVFFAGCAIQYNQTELGRTVVRLLERCGYRPVVATAGCCGLPAMANGDARQARARAEAVVQALSAAGDTPVVTACTSCGHMLKAGFAALLSDDGRLAEKASRIGERTFDLGEFVMAKAGEGARLSPAARPARRLAYHAPCHQLSQGIGRPWFHLLGQVPGVEIVDLNAGCCGMSGTFGFKDEKYPLSMAVGQRLFEAIRANDPEMVVSECATCRMQIEHGSGVTAIHPAELLLEAMPPVP